MEEHVLESPGKIVIRQIYKTLHQYFPDLQENLENLPDLRKRKQYKTSELAMAGISMFLFKEGSRNMYNAVRKEDVFFKNYTKIFDMQLPHLDTSDDFFRQLPKEELEQVKVGMISRLIRNKIIEHGKFRGYYTIAIDATGVINNGEKPCEGCSHKTSKNGKITYYRNVLEAKLITPSGFSLSIATEWITNEGKKQYQKQDCEREAFKRIAKKIKQFYPRLPILLVADGLYPWEGFFDICTQNQWKYILVLKDGNLKTLQEDILLEKRITPKQIVEIKQAEKQTKTTLHYHWLKDMNYRKHKINYVETKETIRNIKTKDEKKQRFVHITNLEINNALCDGISFTGRLRQKIENEGFNIQKNHGYALQHKFSRISFTALQNYYQCLQIAHMINQLVQASKEFNSLLKKVNEYSVKYLWGRLKSFLLEVNTDREEFEKLVSKPFQIRLC